MIFPPKPIHPKGEHKELSKQVSSQKVLEEDNFDQSSILSAWLFQKFISCNLKTC